MPTATQLPLAERLMKPGTNIDPHEVARELTHLCISGDVKGVRKLRDSYLIGIGRAYPARKVDKISKLVDENLLFASGVADIVARDGYEASGQLQMPPRLDGPVAQFYQKATGAQS